MAMWSDPENSSHKGWSIYFPRYGKLWEVYLFESRMVPWLQDTDGFDDYNNEWRKAAEFVNEVPRKYLVQMLALLNPDEIAKWRLTEKT